MLASCSKINDQEIRINYSREHQGQEKPSRARFETPACGSSEKGHSIEFERSKGEGLVRININGTKALLGFKNKENFVNELKELLDKTIGTVENNKRPNLDQLARNVFDELGLAENLSVSLTELKSPPIPCSAVDVQGLRIKLSERYRYGELFPTLYFELPSCGSSVAHKISIAHSGSDNFEVEIDEKKAKLHATNERQS